MTTEAVVTLVTFSIFCGIALALWKQKPGTLNESITTTSEEELGVCPNDPWGRHRWCQTTLARHLDEVVGVEHDPKDQSRSYACEKCHQWKITPQHI